MLYNLFVKHPADVGETYARHFATALEFGCTMIAAGFACVVHALVPRFFEHTASNTVTALHARMTLRRQTHPAPRAEIDYAI
jgi:hypothetical protein